MQERKPDFEDDKIRMWRSRPEGGRNEFEAEDGVLSIDGEFEEIYESRIYGLNSPPELLALRALLVDELGESAGDSRLSASLDEIAGRIADSALKVLAKRRKSDKLITFIVVVTGPGGRALIHRADLVSEKAFRREVRKLETQLLEPGLVNPPLVTSVEEWARYHERLDQ
jgi:hypothetical protein